MKFKRLSSLFGKSYFYDHFPINGIINWLKLCFIIHSLLEVIEYTLLNVSILELKVYGGQNKFYEWSMFGQCDKEKNRAPLPCII